MKDFTQHMINENMKVNGKCGYILKSELEKILKDIFWTNLNKTNNEYYKLWKLI